MTYIWFEPVQLHHARVPRIDLHLVASRRATPLCADEFALVEGERLSTRRFPAEPRLRQSTFARLFGQVEVDIVE